MISPYLMFDSNCEEALNHYVSALGAKIDMIMRNADAPPEVPYAPERKNKIMHARFSIDGDVLMASELAAGTFPEAAGLLRFLADRRSGGGRAQIHRSARRRQRDDAIR